MSRPLVIVLAALAVGAPLRAQTTAPEAQKALARDVYKQLVEINTSDSVGNVTTAANAMAERFRAAGFPESDVQVLVPPNRPAKGNLVVRYHGRAGSTRRPLLLLAHLDVVAANLLRMKAERYIPDRDIILALTADEEGGPANGVEWLIATHKSLIDAAYALNEGGGGTLDGDRPIYHSVQAAEKVSTHFTFTTTNSGGHSSVPRPDNAIYELASALVRLSNGAFPVALNGVSRSFFEQTARVEPRADMAAAMRAIVANSNNADAAATLSRDPRFNSMLRTTCVATRLSGGHANNALPQTATANINCRIVPTSTGDETLAALTRMVADTGVHITWNAPDRAAFGVKANAIDPEILAATTSLTKTMFGDIPVIPTMGTGATDGRYLRAAGIPTYGVSGIFSVPGETNAHGRDEKLRVKSFYDGVQFLDRLVRRLTGSPAL